MNEYIKTIISKLLKSKITEDSFIQKYEKEKKENIDELYIKKLIKRAMQFKNADEIEEALVLIYSGKYNNSVYIEELCSVLLESWHFKHEDIVRILHELKDPYTADSLFKVANMHLDYLDYDDTYQLARKSIKALAAIGNPDALDKLKFFSNSKLSIISDYAKKELKNIGL